MHLLILISYFISPLFTPAPGRLKKIQADWIEIQSGENIKYLWADRTDSLPFINLIPDFLVQPTGQTEQMVDSPIGNITEYLAYIPASYNNSPDKLWPLIIFLHGAGEIGTDINQVKNHGLPKQLAQGENLDFIVISPQCNSGGWWNTPVLENFLTQILLKYNCNPKQIYLTGLSMGGIETWNWGIQDPDLFAAIMPVSATGNPENVGTLRETPVWVFHGAQDQTVSYAGDKAMVDALRQAGGNVKFTTIKGNHDVWDKVYKNREIFSWLIKYQLP